MGMIRRIVLLGLLFTATVSVATGQSGKVLDNESMPSRILNGERHYAVYLPPDYETSERSYPVLYLLHGGGDNQTGWVQFGEVLHIADTAIRNGEATPMVIVMPDASGERRGYFNDIRNEWRYEDFFFEEFMPHVEQKFRIKAEKRYRAVAGLSMGGGGAFMYAMHRPDLFSSAAPLSASTGVMDLAAFKARLEQLKTNLAGLSDEAIQAYFRRHNTLSLIEDLPADSLKSVHWYIDCGDDDFLYEGNALTHIALRKKEIPHEYRVRQGGHTWTYWRESLPAVLAFISQAFHQY